MVDEFDAVAEDEGHCEALGGELCGQAVSCRKTRRACGESKGKEGERSRRVVSEDEEDWEDDDDGEGDESDRDEAPQIIYHPVSCPNPREPEVDENGFIMVKGKGRR